MKKSFLALVLCIAMVLTMFPVMALAMDVDGSKTALKTELNILERETDVTLSLPSAEFRYEYDVVFVMDSSTSTKNSNIDFSKNVNELMTSLTAKDAAVNVGVIKFRGLAFDTIELASGGAQSGLVRYSADTAPVIMNAVNYSEADLKALASGTNVHAGLRKAENLLAADTSVPNDHKFVFLLTDGKTYIWNDANDVATTIYTQRAKVKSVEAGGKVDIDQWAGPKDKSVPVYNPILSQVPTFWFDNYADLYASDSSDFLDGFEYDYRCAYAYKEGNPTGNVEVYATTNGADLFNPDFTAYHNIYKFVPDGAFADMKFLELNPYNYIDNGDGTYTFDTDSLNPAYYMSHADSLQKALYKSGHLWAELNGRYNTVAITFDGWSSNSGASVAYSFCDWMQRNSDYAADIESTADVAAIFDSIEETILHMIKEGIVTDIIPEEFTLKENGTATFTLTCGGETLAAAADGDSAWNFGTANESGVYPYRVEFDAASNSFKWFINVPVENAHPVTLTYTLIIDEDAEYGAHDTNVSAVLEYTSSLDDKDSYTFDIPKVNYVYLYTVTYTDGVDDKVVFENQVNANIKPGSKTPAFAGTPERAGYTFLGWDPEVAETVTEDAVYTAQWEPNSDTSYKVEYYLGQLDGSYALEKKEDLTGTTDTPVSAEILDFTGFTFDEAVEKTLLKGTVKGDGSLVLKVFYNRNFYTVTYTDGVDDKAVFEDQINKNIKFGSKTPDFAGTPERVGYTFRGWDPEVAETVTKDAVYTAQWKPNSDTSYKVEYYLEQLDGSYALEKSADLTGTTDTSVSAEILDFIGFTFDKAAEGTLLKGNVKADGSLTLKVFYNRDSYTVTYRYVGDVPKTASKLPATVSYKFGQTVTVADAAAADGYTFSGWANVGTTKVTISEKGEFVMPAEDLIFEGSFKVTPPTTPTDPTNPQTGDNSNMFLWVALLLVSSGALVGITVYSRKRKKS